MPVGHATVPSRRARGRDERGDDGSKKQGQALDFSNFRVDGPDLLGGLHGDIERQRDVPAAGGGPDRVVQVRARRKLRNDRLDHSPLKVVSGPPDGLDPVNARKRMSRFEKFHGWAMIDVRSHRRPRIGAWFHGSLRAGSEDHQERDYLLSYQTGASSDKSSECFFQGRYLNK